MKYVEILAIFYLLCIFGCQSYQDLNRDCQCVISAQRILNMKYHPMYLYANTSNIFYPNLRNQLILDTGDEIETHCTGYNGVFINGRYMKDQILIIKCLYGETFEYKGSQVGLSDIRCVEPVSASAIFTGKKCGVNGNEIDIGFSLRDGRFLWQYSSCFNLDLQSVEYTRSYILPITTREKQKSEVRRIYSDVCFNLTTVPIYKCFESIHFKFLWNHQLGRDRTQPIWNRYRNSSSVILRRLRLVPPTDYYYYFEQEATQFYINIAPGFSGAQWFVIRMSLRMYARQHRTKVLVYTGTLKVLEGLHKNGTIVPVMISPEKKVPIPEIIWKVLYDETKRAGVAIIVVNNYFKRMKYQPLCTDISTKLPWMVDSVSEYAYACTVEEWYSIVNTTFPLFKVDTILGLDVFGVA